MTNLQELILSVRDIIPDRASNDDPYVDGRAYSLHTLLRWINRAGELIAHNANVIQDWYAIPTVAGQDVYELPDFITSVEQVWYNLLPLDRSSEQENMFTVKRSGSSWWFSPHSIHVIPKLFLFPAPVETAAFTQLDGALGTTATTFPVDLTTGFNVYGFLKVDAEMMRYATVASASTFSNVLRAQSGTTAANHADNAIVTDLNLTFKCFRLPRPVESADGVLEIPKGLHPLIELYVLSKVRSSEQDEQSAMQLRQEFFQAVEKLSAKPATQGTRQGTQIKLWPDGGTSGNVRLYIP